jgi:hypothetical protein
MSTFASIGFISAAAVYTVSYPLETLKLQTQLRQGNNLPKINYRNINYNILRGYTPYIIAYGSFYGIYNMCYKRLSQDGDNFAIKFIKSNIASTAGSGITNPLHMVRTRLQKNLLLHSNNRIISKQNYGQIITHIYQSEGITGFFKGFNATLINNLKLGVMWPLNDYLNSKSYNYITSAFIATCVSNSVLYPTDVIRTTQRNFTNKMSIMNTAKHIYKTNGMRGFFRGIILQMMYSGPGKIMTLSLISYLNRKL